MKKIVHIIENQKFTLGYIEFICKNFNEYEHSFFVPIKSDDWVGDIKKINDVPVIKFRIRELIGKNGYGDLLRKADKIIVSGFFDFSEMMFFWSKDILKKTYIHLWGGDFYCLKNKIKSVREWMGYFTKKVAFRRCKSIIFSIDGENKAFYDITKIKKSYCVAVMPGDIRTDIDFNKYRNRLKSEKCKVIIGNSASQTNYHLDVFRMLEKYRNEDIELYVPLSYGDSNYRDRIIEAGTDIFGKKFHALTEYMTFDAYLDLLGEMDIGVFNCDRQQAMGNIDYLLKMGKKVYLRNNTSMYEMYTNKGFYIHNVMDIANETFDKFIAFDEFLMNCNAANQWDEYGEAIRDWKRIFEL